MDMTPDVTPTTRRGYVDADVALLRDVNPPSEAQHAEQQRQDGVGPDQGLGELRVALASQAEDLRQLRQAFAGMLTLPPAGDQRLPAFANEASGTSQLYACALLLG